MQGRETAFHFLNSVHFTGYPLLYRDPLGYLWLGKVMCWAEPG